MADEGPKSEQSERKDENVAQRPIQVTQDLRGFWDRTYTEVKKELKGRYPKHHWPDDPWNAMPTARAKPRR